MKGNILTAFNLGEKIKFVKDLSTPSLLFLYFLKSSKMPRSEALKFSSWVHHMGQETPLRRGGDCRSPQLVITATQTCFAACLLLNW